MLQIEPNTKPLASVACACAGRAGDRPWNQRDLDAQVLAAMYREAQEASRRFASEENCTQEWSRIWSIEPIQFHPPLLDLCEQAVREIAGAAHRLPSGPLHDAAEVARSGIPAVMMFVQSLRGLSHTKLEDTREEHLEMSVKALDRLAAHTAKWILQG